MNGLQAIGAISIGQSPRPDLLESLRARLAGTKVAIVEAGALDPLTADDIAVPSPDRYPLTTRLRDGTAITVDEAFLEPLVQAAIDLLEGQGCTASILLCAGEFASVRGRRPIVRPFELAAGILRSIGITRVAVAVPIDEQVVPSQRKWAAVGLSATVRSVRLGEIPEAMRRDIDTGVEAVVLDYVGHPPAAVRRLGELLDRPVVDLGDLAAAALASLVADP